MKCEAVYWRGAGGGGVTITVVLSPGLPGSPLLPSAPGAPGAPGAPWGPGTTTVVGGVGAGVGTGTVTTVGLSHAESVTAANSAEASNVCFIVNPLKVEGHGQKNGCDLQTNGHSA